MGNTIDVGLISHLLGELRVFHIRVRLALSSVLGVITGNTAGVDTVAMWVATILGEMSVSFAAHTLGEDDAVLRSVICFLAPNTLLWDRGFGGVLSVLHLGMELGIGKPEGSIVLALENCLDVRIRMML